MNFIFNNFSNEKYDAGFYFGQRNNFISKDNFFGCNAGYYSKSWEFSGELEAAQETYPTQTLHPYSGGLNISYIQNRSLFYVFSGEAAVDENVQIFAWFLRVTYRFGSKETAPLRDGARVRRNL